MQSEAMKQEEIKALAREMTKGVKTEADLEAVTNRYFEDSTAAHLALVTEPVHTLAYVAVVLDPEVAEVPIVGIAYIINDEFIPR